MEFIVIIINNFSNVYHSLPCLMKTGNLDKRSKRVQSGKSFVQGNYYRY